MDTLTGQNCPRDIQDQWLATGTVPASYVRSLLGDRLRSVSASDPVDRGDGTIVARGVVGRAPAPAELAPGSRDLSRQPAGDT